MVAVLPPLLSDQPPEVPQRAGLGDRFRYFRGLSGRRYLFTAVAGEDLRDFTGAVVLAARTAPTGRLAAFAMAAIDDAGRMDARDRRLVLSAGAIVLVHLLAESEAERRALLADLAQPASTTAIAA